MDVMCSYGIPLFSLEDNSTFELIDRLRAFRSSYEPYHAYLCTVICSFGILTNLINVVVLTKRQMRTSINVLLTGIAFCDMGTMASYLIYIIHFVLTKHDCNPFLYTYGWMCFLMGHVLLSIALHTTTLWLSVAMAFIRNMTLRQTRVGSQWLRSDNTWKICGIVYACVFSLSVPSVVSNGIIAWPEYFNTTCNEEPIPDDKAYTIGVPQENCLVFTITFWLSGTLFKIIPCVLIALLICSLFFTIKKAEKNRKALLDVNRNRAVSTARGSNSRQQAADSRGSSSDRTTAMLLMILGIFLLTELPQGAISILSGIYVADMQEYVYPNVADMLDLLSLINSSINFILYCIMSSKYRQVFWQVVLPRKLYVRWFVRPRQSARCRSRNRRRPPPTLATVYGLRRDSYRTREYPGAGGGDDAISEMTDRYEYSVTNDAVTASRYNLTAHDPAATSEFDLPPTYASVSTLLPRNSLKPLPTPRSATSITSLASSSKLISLGANLNRKNVSRLALLKTRTSSTSCDKTLSGQVTPSETARRRFSFRIFRRRPADQTEGKRSFWSVGCSCLCDCAFRTDIESTAVAGAGAADVSNRDKAGEEGKDASLKIEHLDYTVDTEEARGLLSTPARDPTAPEHAANL